MLYAGQVQGVGFRFTTSRVARLFDVTGSVRNLPDGRVELVAEGEPPELDAFLAAVYTSMRSHIRDTEITDEDAQGEYEDFDIRG